MNRRLAIVSAIVLVWGIFVHYLLGAQALPLQKPFSSFPLSIGEWEGRSVEFAEDIVEALGVTDYMSRYYRRGTEQVEAYVGYYDSQGAGKQIHSPKHCLPGGGWSVLSQETREITLAGVGKVRLVEALYEKGGARQLFVYWYRMKDAYVTNDYLLKWHMIVNSLRYRRNEATFVRLSAPAPNGDRRRALAVIQGFMADFLPRLQEHLPR